MKKGDIIKRLASETRLNRKEAAAVMETVMSSIKDAVVAGDTVYLRGFGTFERKTRAAKTARDIRAGRTMTIPAHDIPRFRPSKEFTDRLTKK